MLRTGIAAARFFLAQFAMLAGIVGLEKFDSDEVNDVLVRWMLSRASRE